MKKTILYVILVLILPLSVFAQDNCQKNEYLKDSYKEYKWYRLKEESHYFTMGNNENDYVFLNKEDTILTEFTNWEINKPSIRDGRSIETKTEYKYKRIKPIKYIYINNIKSNKEIIKLDDISLGNNYTLECINCIKEDENYTLKEDSYLKVNLGNNFNIDNFKYKFNEIDSLIVYFLVNDNLESVSFKGIYKNQKLNIEKVKDNYFEDEIISQDKKLSEDKNYILIEEKILYRYRDTLYRYYKLKKEYYDNYSKEKVKDYIYKDEEKYKIINICEPVKIELNKKMNNAIIKKEDGKNIKSTEKDNKGKFKNILVIIILLITIFVIIYIKHKKIKLNMLVINKNK